MNVCAMGNDISQRTVSGEPTGADCQQDVGCARLAFQKSEAIAASVVSAARIVVMDAILIALEWWLLVIRAKPQAEALRSAYGLAHSLRSLGGRDGQRGGKGPALRAGLRAQRLDFAA